MLALYCNENGMRKLQYFCDCFNHCTYNKVGPLLGPKHNYVLYYCFNFSGLLRDYYSTIVPLKCWLLRTYNMEDLL